MMADLSSSDLALQQNTAKAWLHVADAAFGGTHQGNAIYVGTVDLSGSVTRYAVDCTTSMHGCSLPNTGYNISHFYFTEVSGTTTYTIGDGPDSGIVACGPSSDNNEATCIRTPISGQYLTGSNGIFASVTFIDSGYYTVYLTAVPDKVTQALSPKLFFPAEDQLARTTKVITLTTFLPSQTSLTTLLPSQTSQVASQTAGATTSPIPSSSAYVSGSGGFHPSAEFGVGIGVALGGMFAATVAWWTWKKWRTKRNPAKSSLEQHSGSAGAGIPGATIVGGTRELDGQRDRTANNWVKGELNGHGSSRMELDGQRSTRGELDGQGFALGELYRSTPRGIR